MNSLFLRIQILLFGLIIAGCKTLPVVPHAINCDVNAELLASNCAAPRQISGEATYSILVDTMQADRKALRECGFTNNALRDAIKRCNQTTDEYNNKIDSLNNTK